ncbi:rhamnose-binding lectin-like [Clupea harengus]|uniref:Rhamnose-binding lectin-like n=1 Tax=Clupea harengus TaxID=7950 RepID=A0A8M1KHC9_CLUHA|nr:rhamnose-binding lectin-like [Clupea harengus]
MSDRCDGMSSCTVPVTNSVFSDPCRGTYKYLDVSFTCLPASKCDYIFTTSFSNVTVPTDPLWCYTKWFFLFDTQKEVCNGKSSCELDASNAVFSDPCPGVSKYLEVTYSCNDLITSSEEITP